MVLIRSRVALKKKFRKKLEDVNSAFLSAMTGDDAHGDDHYGALTTTINHAEDEYIRGGEKNKGIPFIYLWSSFSFSSSRV